MASDRKTPEQAKQKKSQEKPKITVGGLFKAIGRGIVRAPGAIVRTARVGLWDTDVYRRWFASLIWGLLFFALAWVVGYFLLKPQSLVNTLLSTKMFGYSGKVAIVTLKNFAQQLITILVFIVLLNHFRVGKLNLGHYFFFLYSIGMGLMVGTNSYQFHFHFIDKWKALLPFGLYGVWELIAYGLVLAATTRLAWFETPGLIRGEWVRIRRFRDIPLVGEEIEVLVYGLAILAVSAFGEARQLVGRLGS